MKYALVGLLFTSSTALLAQQNSETPEPEKITVTGSRIKRIDVEGATPLTVIDKEAISKSGTTSVADLLRGFSGSTANFNGGGSSVAGGVATANLRGLGENRTLILLDGVRLPKHPELGAVDLNSIPLAAVERVEVLRQSAAAVYGTDAIGGVINIITRKDYTGQQISAEVRRTRHSGGYSHAINGLTGFATENSNSTLVLSYDGSERIGTNQRDAFRERLSSFGVPGSYSANINGEALGFPAEGCSNYGESGGAITGGNGCTFNYNAYNSLSPEIKRLSALYNLTYNIGSDMTLTTKVIGTLQNSKSQLRPDNSAGSDINATVSQEAIDAMSQERFDRLFPGFQGTKPSEDGVDLKIRFGDFGNSITEKEASLLGTNFNLTGYLGANWEWRVGVNASGSKTTSKSANKLLIAPLNDLLTNGEYIPWDESRDLAAIKSKVVSESYYVEETSTSGGEAFFSGELNDVISLAVGAGAQTEDYKVRFNSQARNGELLNVAGADGGGDREVLFTSIEASFNFIESLEANLAVRFDDYSDFGSTFNPQLALAFQPTSLLKLRASAGTAFKAPTLDELFSAQGVSYNSAVDYTYCENNGISREDCKTNPIAAGQFKNIRGGNPDLDAEKSVVLSAGFVTQPTSSLSLALDYWRVKSKDLIELRQLQDILDEDPDLVTRDADGAVLEIDNRIQNLSKSTRAGFDVVARFDTRFGNTGLGLQSSGTWYVQDRSQRKGRDEENDLGTYGSFKWKLQNSIDLSMDKIGFTLSSLTIGTHAQLGDPEERLPQWSRYNTQVRYNFPTNGILAVGVNNILDSQGPEDPSNFGDISQSWYDIKGLEYYVRLTQDF